MKGNVGGGTKKHLYGIGSILFWGYQQAVVWGSGMSQSIDKYKMTLLRKLDIRLVRGPLTADELNKEGFSVPAVYGDPAVLMPLIYPQKTSKDMKNKKIGVILKQDSNDEILPDNTMLIDMFTNDVFSVVEQICSCSYIISASLHGIIIAESYGVPAILLDDFMGYNDFKYRDWYLSTGRDSFPIAHTVEQAVTLLPSTPMNISSIQNSVIETFPYDLFS
ncbi:MAG: polysaccharide pyruvyl transferase family protein [Bacteroides thetaiotaomicron]|nr:polysaccharide pyruvyl transferase family protein [Bacteroides thetaiotaomicron]